jgi:hypothetical protein
LAATETARAAIERIDASLKCMVDVLIKVKLFVDGLLYSPNFMPIFIDLPGRWWSQ